MSQDNLVPQLDPLKGRRYQIIDVKCKRSDLMKLDASVFIKDVLANDMTAECAWDAPFVRRYEFRTEVPLPSCVSLVHVVSHRTTDIRKEDYFVDKLTAFRDRLSMTIKNTQEVLPPKKFMKVWSQTVMGLTTGPIVKFMRKVWDSAKPTVELRPPLHHPNHTLYKFLRDVLLGEDKKPPKAVAQLTTEIRDLFIQGITVSDAVRGVSTMTQANDTNTILLREYAKIFGMSTTF
jgi:hypothetical protein